MILLLLQTDIHPLWGLLIIIIILGAISLFGRKISNNQKGHRYTEIKDDEKDLKKAAQDYVTNHKEDFVRRHYGHFYKAFMDGARHQRNKTL